MDSDSEIRKLCEEVERKLHQTENGCEFSEIEASDVRQLLSLLRSKLEGERWIPVSESPDIPGWYQVWRKSGLNPLCGSPVESAYWCDGWVAHPEITHWRPLASSPEVMG